MLKIYNSLSKSKDTFVPITPDKIKMYVCGITVYDFCHLGHARVMVCFDVISRYLRQRGWHLEYVRNITDVDDKIIKRAAENNESVSELTERMIVAMHADEDRLNVLRPDQEPRATAHIPDIINMVQELENKGYAYTADNGDVYYAVEKFAEYGKLSKQNIEDLRSGARIEVSTSKRNPLDFVLWKAAKEGELSWSSPWGEGRPGWHIECSAMSKCCLGNHFDIHGGGPDLPFPHHENEIAQSEAANDSAYVNTWMHAGPVRVNSEKMSKSLDNFFSIREILEKYNAEVVRYFLSSVHYRSYIDYSEESLVSARSALERFYQALSDVELNSEPLNNDYEQQFYAAMDDDFNTPKALAVLFELVTELNKAKSVQNSVAGQLATQLIQLANILGLLTQSPEQFLQADAQSGQLTAEEIEASITDRVAAKETKNFAEADRIRDELAGQGVVLKDARGGTKWFRES